MKSKVEMFPYLYLIAGHIICNSVIKLHGKIKGSYKLFSNAHWFHLDSKASNYTTVVIRVQGEISESTDLFLSIHAVACIQKSNSYNEIILNYP